SQLCFCSLRAAPVDPGAPAENQSINASPPPAQFQADPWGITSRGSFACGLQASCVTQADNFWFGSDREELVVLNGGIRGFTVGSAHSSGRQSVGRGDCFSWRQAVDCSNLRRTPRCQPPASAPSDGPFSRSFKEGYSPILTSSIRHLCKAQHLSSQRILGSRSEEHTSELQSRENLVCRLLLEKKK